MRSPRSHFIASHQTPGEGSARGMGRSGLFALVLAVLVMTSGCKTPDFVGRRYSNFTAYYNTFYNAERQFEKGYDNLDRFEDKVDREQYLPLFVKTTGTTASREFEQTILKSADILREHPDSKWVDDALMLIGKSYFYQENYVGAVQKFTEVVGQPSELRDEAHFWLARALITSGAYDEAREVLTTAMALDGADAEWVAQDRLLLAELSIRQERWEDAADHLQAGLTSVKDKELAARASFLLGQVHETLGNHEQAHAAYVDVRNYRAPYELGYAARYAAVRVDGLHLNTDRALREVRKLERDDKNLTKTAELRYLRARVLQEARETDEALFIFDELLYDPLSLPPGASLGDLRGRIHYALGELYRDIDRDFLMAAAHFDTAAAALGSGTGARNTRRSVASSEAALAPEAIQDASLLKDSFSRYARVYRDVARYDSLLYLGSLPQEEYDARILEMRRQRAEELEEQRRLMQQRQREQAFRESAGQSGMNLNRGLPEGKVIPTADDPTGTASGYLQHQDPIRVQEGRMQFQNVWGTRPLVPNWRRSAALNAADVQISEEQLAQQEAMMLEMERNELPDIDDSAVPRDSTDQVAMKSARAISRYEVGNILFLGMSRPDSAAVWYRTVIEEDATEAVASRAMFALAEVQRALGDSLVARRLYADLLRRFPQSDFIPNVQDRLGMEVTRATASDSSALALEALESALRLRTDDPDRAIDSLLTVASKWMAFSEASRALFVVARLHLEAAQGDSAMVFTPIDHSVPPDVLAPLWPTKFGTLSPPDSVITEAIPPVAADSARTATEVAPPDSAGTLTEVVPPDGAEGTLAPTDSVVTTTSTQTNPDNQGGASDAPMSTDLTVEDLLSKIASMEARKERGIQAQAILDALVAWRTPPDPAVDSTQVDSSLQAMEAVAAAELDGVEDGIPSAVADKSLPSAADSTANPLMAAPADGNPVVGPGQAAQPQAAMADSLVMALVARSAARQDSLRAAREREAFMGRRSDRTEEDDEEEVRTTINLKPILPGGGFDTEAVGYTFTFGGHPDLTSAQNQLGALEERLVESGIDLFILTNASGEPLEYLVGWGLFLTRDERDAAEAEFSAMLPEVRNILHLIPAE